MPATRMPPQPPPRAPPTPTSASPPPSPPHHPPATLEGARQGEMFSLRVEDSAGFFIFLQTDLTYMCGRKFRGSDSERALPRCQPSNLYVSSALAWVPIWA